MVEETGRAFANGGFCLGGQDFNPEEFSALLGMQPTEIWRQKREELKQRKDLRHVQWIWELGWHEENVLDVVVQRLIDPFIPKAAEIRGFADRYGCEFEVEVMLRGVLDAIELCIYPATSYKLHVLGCPLHLRVV